MSEAELFLKLLDDKAADTILDHFGENTKYDNLQLKKVKLMKIFRGVPNNKKKVKSKENPFDIAIFRYCKKAFKGINAYELFQLFNSDYDCKIPDYIKFANALFYYPEIVKENLEKITENYKKEEPLFKDVLKFTSDKEVEDFLLKNDICSIKIKNPVIKFILESLDEESNSKLNKLNKTTNDWTLMDYENKVMEESETYPAYLIQLEYLKTHENKTEIENGIALDMLVGYYSEKIDIKNKQDIREDTKNIIKKNEDLNNLLDTVQKENNKITKENKQLKRELNKYELDINKIKDKACEYEESIKEGNLCNEALKNRIKDLESTHDNFKKTSKDIEYKCKAIKEENLKLTVKNNELDTIIQGINTYFDYACSTIESEEQNHIFCVINTIEIKICKLLYPEVLFISANNLDKELYKKESLTDINKIYIQRNGLSSSKISSIEKFAKRNSIETKIIMPRNEREIIEEIVKIKNNV